MTWDPEVIKGFGDRIGVEMTEFGVTLWLAPGMNIHRNALCGRNFEYYSEDPLVAGLTAAYTTMGVQSHPGIGVTIKHFSGNNQENNRNSVNNTITERALREIYLKGFEIAVRMAQPMAIMTSYNQNNSMPAADDYDMCTDITRGEWGFKGLIMTDWGGGQSTPVNSMHAGNDLIMPGGSSQNIINQFTTAKPDFDETTGYVKITGSGWRKTEQWGEFILSAEGTKEESVTVAADVDVENNERIKAKVEDGTATIKTNEDGTKTVTYKGEYGTNSLPLGDLQKSAAAVLHIIMNSTQFEKITKEYEGEVVKAEPYTEKYAEELKTFMEGGEAPALPTPTPTPTPFLFDDVQNKDDYFFAPVYWAVENGITVGTSETTFGPSEGCTRAQVVTFLWRAAGEPKAEKAENPFKDVPADAYYLDAVLWAVEKGITVGTEKDQFSPNDTCTRAQIVTFLYRNAGEPKVEDAENPFKDVPADAYYLNSVLWAVKKEITKGTEADQFSPNETCTRAQVVTFLYRDLAE